MTAGICGCCGLWGARDGGGRCRTCAANMKRLGRCRHKRAADPGRGFNENRAPFYIVSAEKKAEDPGHAWHGPDDYLEAAIGAKCSDELLGFLQTGIGRDVAALLEVHHQQHGVIAWNECPDQACKLLGLRCAEVLIGELAIARVI